MSGGGDTSNGNPGEKDKNDALYEDREPKKIIRIITVTAYMFSVSFVGIVLSAYYIFLWHPPNPRMMHAQAMGAHSEAQVDLSGRTAGAGSGFPRMGRVPEADRVADRVANVFSARLTDENTKKRREILKNVNAVLRANFEKAKSSEAPLEGATLIINSTTTIDNDENDYTLDVNSTSSVSSTPEMMIKTTQKSLTSVRKPTTPTSTTASTSKRSKNPGKKQHQTPFALKHLEMPIKQDESRRRPTQFNTLTETTTRMTTNTRSSPTTLDTRGLSTRLSVTHR